MNTHNIQESVIGPKITQPHQKLIKYLTDSEYENLDWKSPFGYEGMVRIRIFTDGSCLFHAIARSYFKPYITGKIDGRSFDRKDFIKKLRKSLSIKLGSKTDPADPNSLTYYDNLSRGQLAEFAESVPSYSLENMKNELDSNHPVDNIYNEFISNQLNKDIYILDGVKRDVYITGNDDDILYKNRSSIVILYLPGHYELIGLLETNNNIKVLFDPDHDFIQTIRARMSELRIINR
jgi:hypothetical protein